ncbi:endonuclease domain-containing protein [Candidatus Saccharibacteria bacterium]|nr:MAG: endonuclease domain-containing protein [Candidatus Saccharibacteria bacterium]
MTPNYKSFIFKGYHFDTASKRLKLSYGFDDVWSFTEEYGLDFPFVDYDEQALNRVVQDLFFMAGVSYYKAFPTEQIRIDHGQLDRPAAEFFSNTYQKGLGEYFYINKLDPKTDIPFIATTEHLPALQHQERSGQLVAIGGGKDSLVSIEKLRGQPKVATWSLGHRNQLQPLVDRVGLKHFWVDRKLDPQLLSLSDHGALGGHIPISAIFACVGAIVAVLTGYQDVVVSNESSADEPTLHYNRVAINHQYSKSSAHEKAYQAHLARIFGDSLRYYSFLRPLSEVHIAEIFAAEGFEKYKDLFSSCNRAFVQGSDKMSWCGVCSKCAFSFLAFSPFINRIELEKLWHKNLLLDPTLVTTYQNLLGISGNKPLDCVGEVKESRAAMRLAQEKYPGLGYEFDIPESYDYKALAPHSMPDEIYSLLQPVKD